MFYFYSCLISRTTIFRVSPLDPVSAATSVNNVKNILTDFRFFVLFRIYLLYRNLEFSYESFLYQPPVLARKAEVSHFQSAQFSNFVNIFSPIWIGEVSRKAVSMFNEITYFFTNIQYSTHYERSINIFFKNENIFQPSSFNPTSQPTE